MPFDVFSLFSFFSGIWSLSVYVQIILVSLLYFQLPNHRLIAVQRDSRQGILKGCVRWIIAIIDPNPNKRRRRPLLLLTCVGLIAVLACVPHALAPSRQILDGLHARGIIHHDLKCDNIIVDTGSNNKKKIKKEENT